MSLKLNGHRFESNSFSDFTAVLLSETTTTYTCMEPLAYIWMTKHTGFPISLSLPTHTFKKQDVRTKPIPVFVDMESWIFDFPLHLFTEGDLSHILSFFTSFCRYQHERLTARLEKTIEREKNHIPLYLMQPLVKFVCEQSENDSDRIRLLLSKPINDYIRVSD